MGEWISVKERLPEFDVPVVGLSELGPFIFELCPTTEYYDQYWALLNFDGHDGIETYSEIDVTHWMPLPEPPSDLKGSA